MVVIESTNKTFVPDYDTLKNQSLDKIANDNSAASLTFTIGEVTSEGQITVVFSEVMVIPMNYKDFDE